MFETTTALAGQLAGVLGALGYPFYFIAIQTGKIKPSKATWVVWAGVGLMLLITSYASGTRDGIWIPVAYFVGPLITAILCFKKSQGGWELTDKVCLGIAGASLLLWWFTGSPVLALAANLVADGAGSWPTIQKSYHDPESEDRWAWGIWITANGINLFAVEHWTFAGCAYPVYMASASGLIAACVLLRPRRTAP